MQHALGDYNQAIKLNDKNAIARYNRGLIYHNQQRYDQAIDDFSEAVRIKPNYAEAWWARGKSRVQLKDRRGAIADYTEAIRFQPDNAGPYCDRGVAHYNLGEYEQALADCTKAIQIEPNSADPYYSRGRTNTKLGRYEDAIADFSQAIELRQSFADAYRDRAIAYEYIANIKAARADYEQAAALYQRFGMTEDDNSSVTDPYQPIERKLELTHAILEELAAYHQVRLVVQTRGPLVTRDIDLLRRFAAVRVNMTVTTDDEVVRKVFEPGCASIERRLAATAEVQRAGIASCITMTPLLPVIDPARFAQQLLAIGITQFVAQYLHAPRGQFVAGTRAAALALCEERGWDEAAYRRTLEVLRSALPQLVEGRDGFVLV